MFNNTGYVLLGADTTILSRFPVEEIPTDRSSRLIIFGGDFNVPANDGCLAPLHDRLTDAFSLGGIGWGHTALNDVPLFRIDQIWVSRNLSVKSVRAYRSKNSDHRMVVCRLLD